MSGDRQISHGKDRPMTYYDVLELDRDASAEEIRDSYHALARQYHPDVVGQDPKSTQRFALINEAYRILNDQQRRYQYDRTLPQKSYPLRHPTPQKLWKEATDVVLIRSDRFGPLNQAMQATLPICLDEGLLVLTIPGSERHLAGHMETAANHNSIMNALEMVYGQALDFRLIDGATLEDWKALKAAEERAKAAASRNRAAAAPPAASSSAAAAATSAPRTGDTQWDELIQRIHKSYQELPKRQYPQVKARFVRDILKWVSQVEEDRKYAEEASEEGNDRGLARVLERLGSVVDLPAVLVGVMYETLKRSGEI
jgi:hypothetical protein